MPPLPGLRTTCCHARLVDETIETDGSMLPSKIDTAAASRVLPCLPVTFGSLKAGFTRYRAGSNQKMSWGVNPLGSLPFLLLPKSMIRFLSCTYMLHDTTGILLGAEKDMRGYNCLPTSRIDFASGKRLPACLAGRKCNNSSKIIMF